MKTTCLTVALLCVVLAMGSARADSPCNLTEIDSVTGTFSGFVTVLSTLFSASESYSTTLKSNGDFESKVSSSSGSCHCSLKFSGLTWKWQNGTSSSSQAVVLFNMTNTGDFKCSDSGSCTEEKCASTNINYKDFNCTAFANKNFSFGVNSFPFPIQSVTIGEGNNTCVQGMPVVKYLATTGLGVIVPEAMRKQEWYTSLWFLVTVGIIAVVLVLCCLCCCCLAAFKMMTGSKRSAYDEM